MALAECGWGGDYPADDVARHFDGLEGHENVTQVFDHVRRTHEMGFECHVDKDEALRWIAANRSALLDRACRACDEDPADFLSRVPAP